jgi:hypothetical protein
MPNPPAGFYQTSTKVIAGLQEPIIAALARRPCGFAVGGFLRRKIIVVKARKA